MDTLRRGATAAAAAACALFAFSSPAASDTHGPYSLTVTALTGPQGADATVGVYAAPGAAPADMLKKVQIKVFGDGPDVVDVRNLKDVALTQGAVHLSLGQVPRGHRVEVDALVQTAAAPATFVTTGAATTRLRPDLVVRTVSAPPQTTTSRAIDVTADIAEVNGDTGATATATLMLGPTQLAASEPVTVAAGGVASVTFDGVTIPTPVVSELSVFVSDATPGETDATNNTRARTVDVTADELAGSRVVLSSFGGYGAQFNNHLYAPITPTPPNGYGDVEDKVKELEPQLVRIFYNDNWEENKDGKHPDFAENYASFVKVVELAQQAGATILISYQNIAYARLHPQETMAKYAGVLEDLVANHRLTNVRWVEVGNEPNSPTGAVTLDQYNALYRALNAELVNRGLRTQIHMMAGGLVESSGARNHYAWLQWIGANMGDIVDAYSEHVYWWYDKPGRLEFRLRDIRTLAQDVLPAAQRKPMYLMEFGIRGYETCGTKPPFANRYYLPDCTEMWRTNIAAFQQLWFVVHTAQLGLDGAAKWDAYQAVYDFTSVNAQLHWLIGPESEGWPLMPSYYALSLVFHTMERGWRVVGIDPWESDDWTVPTPNDGNTSNDQPEQELTAYEGPNGELTVLGLDTHGRALNGASTETSAYSIGGLPANETFNLALWNATGDGTNSVAGQVVTNAAGVARFSAPLQAAFALTTVPVS
jgi:hypothetical protein